MTKSVKEMSREALVEKLRDKATAGKPKPAPTPPPKKVESAFEEGVVTTGTEGSVMFSTVYGFTPDFGDFPVPDYTDKDWGEWAEYIPDEADFEDFVVPQDVLAKELLAITNNLKTLVVGPSGSGKTTLQAYICAKLKQPYYRINGRQDMESDTLLGKPWVSEGSMTYEMGELPKAMQAGVFVAFDEPWKTPAGIQMALQRMYERGGILQLDDMPGTLQEKQIVPKDTFRIVLCDNVVGTGDNMDKYGATLIQDASTLNRIDLVLELGYLKEEDEVEMIRKKHPAITKVYAQKMVKLFNLLRTNYEQGELSVACSPRNLDAWGMLAVQMKDMRKAFEATMLGRFADTAERAAVESHWKLVFAE